ncbi:MAG: glutamine synthetase family protein, partial [Pseudomonadota bacterium]
GGMKMPVSSYALDIYSIDTAEAKLSIETGDPDGVLIPVPGSLRRVPWGQRQVAQVQAQITQVDGVSPCPFDPRTVLASVANEAAQRGLTTVMALELEFFLIDPTDPCPAREPGTGKRLENPQIYVMDVLRPFAEIMEEIATAARALGAPAETVITEFGPGQFEMNLGHVADPVAAADQMVALKRAIRGVARHHGLDATFMAKPYGTQYGSGLHLHMSLLDQDGSSVFSSEEGVCPAARHAVAGLLTTMADFMLVFAPHSNSYRRLAPGSFAPVVAAWGLDNRGTSVRMPETSGPGARIEHRTSGADANPYLVAAAVLAGALQGLDDKREPPMPITREARPGDGPDLPLSWWAAERRLTESEIVARWFGTEFRRVFSAQKRQERAALLAEVPPSEYSVYLRALA